MIIGLTGSLAAGKGVVAEFLKEKGFVYLSLSDELRELLKEKKIKITRKNLQDCANKFREENGSDYLARRIISKIKNQQYIKAIVDGIRNPGEVETLRKELKEDFFLVSVDAPEKTRFKRMKKRARESDPDTIEEFRKVDRRDKGIGEKASGQGVGKCMAKADFTLINSGSLKKVKEKINKLYKEIQKRINSEGITDYQRPSWEEYFLRIAKEVGKRTTCDRARVGGGGCVVVKNKQILVTGYVGSPSGLPHCDEVGHHFKKTIHEDGKMSNHCVRTIHSEQNAICQAAKLGVPLEGSTMYCFMTPCRTCAMLIINSGIKKVVAQKDYHASKATKKIFEKTGIELKILDKEITRYNKQ